MEAAPHWSSITEEKVESCFSSGSGGVAHQEEQNQQVEEAAKEPFYKLTL